MTIEDFMFVAPELCEKILNTAYNTQMYFGYMVTDGEILRAIRREYRDQNTLVSTRRQRMIRRKCNEMTFARYREEVDKMESNISRCSAMAMAKSANRK